VHHILIWISSPPPLRIALAADAFTPEFHNLLICTVTILFHVALRRNRPKTTSSNPGRFSPLPQPLCRYKGSVVLPVQRNSQEVCAQFNGGVRVHLDRAHLPPLPTSLPFLPPQHHIRLLTSTSLFSLNGMAEGFQPTPREASINVHEGNAAASSEAAILLPSPALSAAEGGNGGLVYEDDEGGVGRDQYGRSLYLNQQVRS
jgi:hypothetical protein